MRTLSKVVGFAEIDRFAYIR